MAVFVIGGNKELIPLLVRTIVAREADGLAWQPGQRKFPVQPCRSLHAHLVLKPGVSAKDRCRESEPTRGDSHSERWNAIHRPDSCRERRDRAICLKSPTCAKSQVCH